MIPRAWQIVTLGRIATFKSGGTPSKQQPDYWGGGNPWVSAKDLKKHYIDRSIDTLTDAGYSAAHIAPQGSSLILVRGMSLLKDFPVGFATRDVAFNQDLKALVPRTDVDPLFLSYLLVAHKEQIRKMVSVAGHGTGKVETDQLKAFEVLLPPLTEQVKISAILSTLEKLVEGTEKLAANSFMQSRVMSQQLLTGKRRMGSNSTPRSTVLTRYGLIPTDWDLVQLGEIAIEVSERHTGDESYPVLSCSKYHGFVSSLEYFKKQVFSNDLSNYKIVKRGDFGFPSNHIEEGSIGYQNICDHGVVSPIYTVFRAGVDVVGSFLYKLLKTDHYRQIFSANTNASVDRRGSLRWAEFSKIRVPLPSLEEQMKISAAVDMADEQISNLGNQLDSLKHQKNALMQQLLTGKRRVKLDAQVEEAS